MASAKPTAASLLDNAAEVLKEALLQRSTRRDNIACLRQAVRVAEEALHSALDHGRPATRDGASHAKDRSPHSNANGGALSKARAVYQQPKRSRSSQRKAVKEAPIAPRVTSVSQLLDTVQGTVATLAAVDALLLKAGTTLEACESFKEHSIKDAKNLFAHIVDVVSGLIREVDGAAKCFLEGLQKDMTLVLGTQGKLAHITHEVAHLGKMAELFCCPEQRPDILETDLIGGICTASELSVVKRCVNLAPSLSNAVLLDIVLLTVRGAPRTPEACSLVAKFVSSAATKPHCRNNPGILSPIQSVLKELSTHRVKVHYEGEIRLTTLCSEAEFCDVRSTVQDFLALPPSKQIALRYHDAVGDVITIKTTEEWRYCWAAFLQREGGDPHLSVYVTNVINTPNVLMAKPKRRSPIAGPIAAAAAADPTPTLQPTPTPMAAAENMNRWLENADPLMSLRSVASEATVFLPREDAPSAGAAGCGGMQNGGFGRRRRSSSGGNNKPGGKIQQRPSPGVKPLLGGGFEGSRPLVMKGSGLDGRR